MEQIDIANDFNPSEICIESDLEMSAEWGSNDKYQCDAFYGYDNIAQSDRGKLS